MKIHIYKLIGNNNVWIGSTRKPLKDTFSQTKTDFKLYQKKKRFFSGAFNTFDGKTYPSIQLIEIFECDTYKQAINKKLEIIKNHQCVNNEKINTNKAGGKIIKRYI
jgi:hypothetical protein